MWEKLLAYVSVKKQLAKNKNKRKIKLQSNLMRLKIESKGINPEAQKCLLSIMFIIGVVL